MRGLDSSQVGCLVTIIRAMDAAYLRWQNEKQKSET